MKNKTLNLTLNRRKCINFHLTDDATEYINQTSNERLATVQNLAVKNELIILTASALVHFAAV